MKVSIVSESLADEAAIRILIEGMFGRQTQSVAPSAVRSPGISGTLHILPSALKEFHYHADVEAFVIVVDSDKTPVHGDMHEQPGRADSRCRLCLLRQTVAQTQEKLRPRFDRPPLKFALGVAVPAIEAWYQCGVNAQVNEAAWIRALQARSYPYSAKSLKQEVYGMDRPPLPVAIQRAVEAARRLPQDFTLLEKLFPVGFGALIQGVRSW